MRLLTFEIAILLILKHAASLCISDISARVALTQAESDFHSANVISKIEEHFTASYEEYTFEQFVDFLINNDIGLSICVSTQTIAYTALKDA